MKSIALLFLSLIALSSSQEVVLQTTPLDFVKCVLSSETLVEDLKKVIELVKEGDCMKLILGLIEMFPKAYEEVNKCLNSEVILKDKSKKLNCKMENRTFYTCTWRSIDSCCNTGKSCKKLTTPRICSRRIRYTDVHRIEKELNEENKTI